MKLDNMFKKTRIVSRIQSHTGGSGHATESLLDCLEEFLAVGVFPEGVVVG